MKVASRIFTLCCSMFPNIELLFLAIHYSQTSNHYFLCTNEILKYHNSKQKVETKSTIFVKTPYMNSKRKGYFIADQFAAHFLTFTVVGWVDLFNRKECRDILIESMRYCQKNKALIIHAYVIMGNHMHVVWRAKENSEGLSAIVRDFKRYTSNKLIKWVLESNKESRKAWLKVVFQYHAKFNKNNKNYQVWKRDNKPKVLIHPRFTLRKINYIHNNPVKARLVRKPEEYIYSSAGNYFGSEDNLLEVTVIDYGIQEGYVIL